MSKNIKNKLQKRKMTTIKKLICIVLVLVIGLPLSGFSMEKQVHVGLPQIDVTGNTVENLCHFEDDRYYETTFDGLAAVATHEVVVNYLTDFQDIYINAPCQILSDDNVTVVLGSEENDGTHLYETIIVDALHGLPIHVDDIQNIITLPEREVNDLERTTTLAPTITISPSTNWTNIPTAGGAGAQRTVTITTNLPLSNITISRPNWLDITVSGNTFTLTAQRNTIAAPRTGTVSVVGGGVIRSFDATQLAAPAELDILPNHDWTNIPAAGGSINSRVMTIITNIPLGNITVTRPPWLEFASSGNVITLTPQRNTIADTRRGTVSVAGGGITRSFTVTQSPATAELTISPTTDWVGLSTAGNEQRIVTITTNVPLGNITVTRPPWLNFETSVNRFTLTSQFNPFFVPRIGTVLVAGGGITRSFAVMQLSHPPLNPIFTQTEPYVIACHGRRGYMDVFNSTTTTTVDCIGRHIARRPMWRFVHINSNLYAIRNETTGRYLTETNGNLRHEARIGSTGSNSRQRWALERQGDGSFRIRSMSNTNLFITEDNSNHLFSRPGIGLATLNTSNNRQLWWVDLIWHNLPGQNFVFYWPGAINVLTHPVLTPPANFNLPSRVHEARTVWSNALGINVNATTNINNANIQAFGGTLEEMQEISGNDNSWAGLACIQYVTLTFGRGFYANGELRYVVRLDGTGATSARMFVVTGMSENETRMTTIHELGHVLGYWGHAPNSSCVMYWRIPPTGPNTVLSQAERAHLRQVYVIFR